MNNIVVILTCYNRASKTVNCLKSLVKGNTNLNFKFVIVDDGSKDGTQDEIKKLGYNIIYIKGDGSLYWNGGMRLAISCILENNIQADYYLFVNDDVDFFSKSIEKLVKNISDKKNSVIVGATCDEYKQLTYGAIKYNSISSIKYKTIGPNLSKIECDTFNANCVLIPYSIFKKTGNLDSKYTHSMGDFDYGLKISKAGYKIYSSDDYVGKCEKNEIKNSWKDNTLEIRERLKLKESLKGLPRKEWFYFLKKNFGYRKAIIYSITPYLKILLKK